MDTSKRKTKNDLSTMISEMNSPISSSPNKQGVIVTPGAYTNSPQNSLQRVCEPHDNDVLCGRGGSINSHPGNERFRQLVEKRKRVYLTARFKREKRLIASSILSEIRVLKPPGRFLAKDTKTGNWYDIGDEKARDKTSQALRENAPSIRAEIEVEINQQRAEMQRAEEEEAAFAAACASGPPHPYYQQPWSYYPQYPGYGQYHAESLPYGQSDSYEDQRQIRHSEEDEQSINRSHSSVGSARDIPRCHQYFDRHRDHAHSMRVKRRGPHLPPSNHDEMSRSRTSPQRKVVHYVQQCHSLDQIEPHKSHRPPQRNIVHHVQQCHSLDQIEPPKSLRPPQRNIVHHVQQCHSFDQIEPRGSRRMAHFEDGDSRNYGHHSPYHYGHRRCDSGSDYYSPSPPSHLSGSQHDNEKDKSYQQGVLTNTVTPENAARKPLCRQDDGSIKHHLGSRGDEVILSHPECTQNDEAAHPYPVQRRDKDIRLFHPAHKQDDELVRTHPGSPETYQHGGQSVSLLSQVANHIMGSWDTSMACANSSIEGSLLSSTGSRHVKRSHKDHHHPMRSSLADAMEDEEQGQEVELVEMEECQRGPEKSTIEEEDDDIRDEEHRIPPPAATGMQSPSRRIEIDWSTKMTGCQSNWLPETFNPPSFFVQKDNPLSPSPSYEMDESAGGTEGGSVGGSSLCQVFVQDQIADGNNIPIFLAGGNQVISQMPSWERSVRSKSPSTICSDSSVQDTKVTTSIGSSAGDRLFHTTGTLISQVKDYDMKE